MLTYFDLPFLTSLKIPLLLLLLLFLLLLLLTVLTVSVLPCW